MNNVMFPYGYNAAFTHLNGLTSDVRSYNGTVDLLKLNVQLLNENGSPMQLNGLDFSFLMKRSGGGKRKTRHVKRKCSTKKKGTKRNSI